MAQVQGPPRTPIGDLPPSLVDLAEQLRGITVEVQSGDPGSGSGVIWPPDGLIVTNAHVVRTSAATVLLPDGTAHAARLVGRDRRRDLAALQLVSGSLPSAKLGEAGRLRTGELVAALGNPRGARGALSLGIVHAVEPRPLRWIRSDIRLAPGNSGGPLANARGEVVGVNCMIFQGLGIALAGSEVARFLGKLASRPVLGLMVGPVSVREQARGTGLRVLRVTPNGAADRAGLFAGDILLRAGDRVITQPDDLLAAVRGVGSETRLQVELMRAGRIMTATVRFPTGSPGGRAA